MRITFFNLRAHGLFDASDPTVFGGAEVQLYHLSTGLAARGHQVTFITRGPGPRESKHVKGVRVEKLPLRGGVLGRVTTLLESFFGLLRSRADVLVQRCAGFETAMVAAAARLNGARFCFMTASLLDCRDQAAQEGRPWMYNVYLWGLHRAAHVICQNEIQQALLAENFGIYANVLPSACAPVRGEQSFAYGAADRKVLWVGRCDPYKDPLSFLRLARELPNIPFVMIMPPGDHPAYQKEVKEEAKGLSNLEVRQAVSFYEMETVYRHASILVNTSTLEGFPNTFLEAMRMGVPLLSYRLDPGGILVEKRTGICVGGDFRALMDLCASWHEKPERARQYGKAGRDYVKRTHDREVVVERFERILTSNLPKGSA